MTAWPGPSHPTGPAGPGPSGPAGPNGPQPSGPAPEPADDRIFSAVDVLHADLARPSKPRPPSKPPRKPINTKPIRGLMLDSEGGRAGVLPVRPGAVSGSFALPVPLGLPRFGGDDRPVPGQPGPPPDPKPYPPPVVEPPPWVVSRRRLAELGCGPLYDVLPGGAR